MKTKNKLQSKVPYKSILDRYKNIENRNKAFNALDDETKRKEIAWDALSLLGKGIIIPSYHYWASSLAVIEQSDSKEFQKKLIEELPESCEVCQRGLLMVSQIRLGNEISTDTANYASGVEISTILKGFL